MAMPSSRAQPCTAVRRGPSSGCAAARISSDEPNASQRSGSSAISAPPRRGLPDEALGGGQVVVGRAAGAQLDAGDARVHGALYPAHFADGLGTAPARGDPHRSASSWLAARGRARARPTRSSRTSRARRATSTASAAPRRPTSSARRARRPGPIRARSRRPATSTGSRTTSASERTARRSWRLPRRCRAALLPRLHDAALRQSVDIGAIRCRSAVNGVTCRFVRGKHAGFRIAREGYIVWRT